MDGRSGWSAVADTVVLARRAAPTHREPARSARPAPSTIVIALAVVVAVLGAVGYRFLPDPSSVAHRDGALTEADGLVPDHLTVFDDDVPAVADLDPALRYALRRAATDAAGAGVEFVVNSGWRSPAYQDQLLREAVSRYGSEAEAARWVSTADTSRHVSGHAVDIGPARAATWLAEHGADYGLCRVYRNEPWHYELRPGAVDDGCPPLYADPTHDPRMQK
jgi:D-alanyl-D-alanine carboxypeptidase